MTPKWSHSTETTVKVPSLQTMLLVFLLSGSLVVIICLSIATNLDAPRPVQAPPSTEGPAAWLSAWSTFWGAIAGGLGAIGTAGALLLGAYTFMRQVRDQHRAQASRVIVQMERDGDFPPHAIVRNLSGLPIYKVRLAAAPHNAFRDHFTESKDVLIGDWQVTVPDEYIEISVTVEFQDSAGTRWIRWAEGGLAEKKGESYELA